MQSNAIDLSGNSVKRFLITTADESTWVFDRPVLFLGHWCLDQNRKHVWSKMDYIVFDPKLSTVELDEHFLSMNQLYDDLFIELSIALNTFHRSEYSQRFWAILVGPWLRFFCNQLMFRWVHLVGAISHFEINEHNLGFKTDQINLHPHSFLDYQRLANNEKWSEYIYSKLLRSNLQSKNVRTLDRIELSPMDKLPNRMVKTNAQVRSIGNGIVIADSYLPRRSEFLLKLLAQSGALRIPRIAAPSIEQDPNQRARLSFLIQTTSPTHLAFRELVIDQLPSAYLEGFNQLIDSANRLKLPSHPKTIFTSNRHLYDDVFNVWAAQATERGSRYVIGQHGGNYGSSQFKSHAELHEEQIADVYMTWGWGTLTNQINGPCLKTVGQKIRSPLKTKIALVVGDHMWAHPRSLFSDISESVGYLEYVSQCINRLPNQIKRDVQFRIQPGHERFGSSQLDWWSENSPQTKINNSKLSFNNLLRSSRLVVSTSNQTTFLQTLNLNIPTLLTWHESYCKLRPEATPYFDVLEEAGILHKSVDSFVNHLSQHWDEIEIWWKHNDVQRARQLFCEQFSRTEIRPFKFLLEELNWRDHNCD